MKLHPCTPQCHLVHGLVLKWILEWRRGASISPWHHVHSHLQWCICLPQAAWSVLSWCGQMQSRSAKKSNTKTHQSSNVVMLYTGLDVDAGICGSILSIPLIFPGRAASQPVPLWTHTQSLHWSWVPAACHPTHCAWTDLSHFWGQILPWEKKTALQEKWQLQVLASRQGQHIKHKSDSHFFLAVSRLCRISGRSPWRTELFTNRLPAGVLMNWSGDNLEKCTRVLVCKGAGLLSGRVLLTPMRICRNLS